MDESILEASHVEFKYQDGTKAIRDLSLSVKKGGKAAFLGPNGAGKTTLFLHFNGILRPSQGRVRFAGRDVRYDHASLVDLRKNVGIVFQDPDTQLFSASVLQEVSFGPFNMGLPEDQVRQCVDEAMAATEIADLRGRPTHLLSYGQKKRVSIADILAMDPQVIIFDEPTACLDPRLALRVMDLLDRLSRGGKTVILSTHDVDLAYSWADYVFVMKNGEVAGEGLPESIFQNEKILAQADLKKPWLLEVYGELKKKGWLLNGATVPRTKEQLFEHVSENKSFGHARMLKAESRR